jgi:Zn-dependent peptidase ImmA (M78 family)
MPTETRLQATEDANRILEIAWKTEPVPIPVDPIRIATTLGIAVFNQILDADIAGAIVKVDGGDPIILLNAADSPSRKRFTCAHEIGHFIAHSNAYGDYEFVDLRGVLATEVKDLEEAYANELAACLLLPASEVTRMVHNGDLPAQMAVRFGVSTEVISYRIQAMLKPRHGFADIYIEE